MRTTIAIDDDLLGELMQTEGDVSRSEAIRRAIQSYLRQRREDDFMRLAGSRLVDLDWRTPERQDLDKARQSESVTRGRRRARRR